MGAKKTEADFFFTDEATGERFDLIDGFVVGRTQGEYRFPDDLRISGKHAKFTIDSAGVHIEDLGSRNGVLLNGKKITPGQSARVLPGDMIEIGNHTFCIGRSNHVPLSSLAKIREETSTEVLSRTNAPVLPPETPPDKKSAKPHGPAPVMDLNELTATPDKPKKKSKSKSQDISENTPVMDLRIERKSSGPAPAHAFEFESGASPQPNLPAPVFATLAAMVALFAAMTAMGVDPIRPLLSDVVTWGANYGPKTTHGEWWRLFTSAFVHAGLVQLVASCFAYWQIALALRSHSGVTGILSTFSCSQLIGALTFVSLQPEQAGFGATPGIMGLMGALAIAYLRDRTILESRAKLVLLMSVAVLLASNLGASLKTLADAPALALAFATGGLMQLISAPASGWSQLTGLMRWIRPAAAVSIVVTGLYFGARQVAPVADPSIPVRAVLEKMLPLAERYDQVHARVKATPSAGMDMIQAIHKDFLPNLRKLKNELDAAPALHDERQAAIESLKSAFAAWERAWTLQAQGLANNDLARLKEAMEFEAAGFKHFESATRVLEKWKLRPAR
ncbi:MAG: rhomboid family intramembrane serine protease [Bdellovibrionaceae bacterium]|nr:rhomboid family intramembrane serine protease [Pseudobdellovibrionaceae bacterium]